MKREESSQSGCEVSSLCTGFVADYYIFHQREINCERFEPLNILPSVFFVGVSLCV